MSLILHEKKRVGLIKHRLWLPQPFDVTLIDQVLLIELIERQSVIGKDYNGKSTFFSIESVKHS